MYLEALVGTDAHWTAIRGHDSLKRNVDVVFLKTCIQYALPELHTRARKSLATPYKTFHINTLNKLRNLWKSPPIPGLHFYFELCVSKYLNSQLICLMHAELQCIATQFNKRKPQSLYPDPHPSLQRPFIYPAPKLIHQTALNPLTRVKIPNKGIL